MRPPELRHADECIVAILSAVVAPVRPRGGRLSGGLFAVLAARVEPPHLEPRVYGRAAGHAVPHDEPPGITAAGGRPRPDRLFRRLSDRVSDWPGDRRLAVQTRWHLAIRVCTRRHILEYRVDGTADREAGARRDGGSGRGPVTDFQRTDPVDAGQRVGGMVPAGLLHPRGVLEERRRGA